MRFQRAESVNLSVMSICMSSMRFWTICRSFFMYLGSDPSSEVSLVEIFAAAERDYF